VIGKIISHYRVLDKIGAGGMGVVYEAEDTKLKRKAALKFLSTNLTQNRDAKTRFEREAQAAAALNHPNIVTIYEINEFEDQTYIAMEYVKGETLKEIISGIGAPREVSSEQKATLRLPLPISEIVEITIQICNGLKKAHEAGIFHRDIKPQNIMVDQDDRVIILDFGLAKLIGASPLTAQSTTVGTIHYMSPEQLGGGDIDQRTDLWALGVVLYETLNGQPPFKGDYPQSIMYSILNEEIERITLIRPDVPMELELIIKKALAKDAGERYQNSDQILGDLNKLKKNLESGKQNSKKLSPSIAVLPFVDMSAQKDQEYFCDGISEELINALAQIRDLRVVARTSAFAFKGMDKDVREIGKALNVSHVLEGSIRKSGDRLRISAQLINVSDGFHIWSERFDRNLENIFVVQDEISFAMVDALKVKLLGKEKEKIKKRYTENLDAYHLYLKGIFHQNKFSETGARKAMEYFREAAEKDEKFALAYVGIALSYGNLGTLSFLPPEQVLPKAKEALNTALKIDESLSDAHATYAYFNFFYEWDWEKAETGFKRALQLNPGNAYAHGWYSWYLLAMGRFDEAIKEINKAQEIDPIMPLYYAFAIAIYGYSGDFTHSIEQFKKATELDPNLGIAYMHVGTTYLGHKRINEATQSFQKAIELSTGSGWAEGCMAGVYAMSGELGKAREILEQLTSKGKTEYISPFMVAFVLYFLGEKEKSLEGFEKAYQERDILMALSKVILGLDEVRKEPKFQAILRKMKLIE